MPEAWGAKGSLRTSGSAWWSRFGQAHGHQVAPSAPRGRPCGLCLAWGSGEQEQEAQGVVEPGQPPPPGPGGRPGLSSRAWGSLWKGPSLHSPGRHGPSWDLPAVHPCGQAVEPSRGLSPVSPAEGAGHPPPHPVPLPATRWGAAQQTQLWPLLADWSAPTLGAHTFPGPSPPDSPSGAAWTPPPPGSPPPVTPGPRTCPAVCVLPQPALLPAALGGGPLGPLLWAFLPLRVAPPSEPCYPALPPSVRPEFYVLWWERVSVGLPGEEQGPPECGVAVPQE